MIFAITFRFWKATNIIERFEKIEKKLNGPENEPENGTFGRIKVLEGQVEALRSKTVDDVAQQGQINRVDAELQDLRSLLGVSPSPEMRREAIRRKLTGSNHGENIEDAERPELRSGEINTGRMRAYGVPQEHLPSHPRHPVLGRPILPIPGPLAREDPKSEVPRPDPRPDPWATGRKKK